jgi:MoaA/NifB/PqqE/SkfB family radical SAM enzyme
VDAGENEADGVLSTEEALSVIDQIRATGKPVVVLSGGEPLLHGDAAVLPVSRIAGFL